MQIQIAPFYALIIPTEAQQPGQPPLGIWGPSDGRPTNPIAGWNPGTGTFPPPPGGGQPPLGFWGPNDPRPTLPIAGWNPGTGTWPQPPGGGGGQPEHPITLPPETPTPPPGSGVVVPLPPAPDGTPPPTPPEGIPADSAAMVVWFGPGTLPVPVWVPPYAAQQ